MEQGVEKSQLSIVENGIRTDCSLSKTSSEFLQSRSSLSHVQKLTIRVLLVVRALANGIETLHLL